MFYCVWISLVRRIRVRGGSRDEVWIVAHRRYSCRTSSLSARRHRICSERTYPWRWSKSYQIAHTHALHRALAVMRWWWGCMSFRSTWRWEEGGSPGYAAAWHRSPVGFARVSGRCHSRQTSVHSKLSKSFAATSERWEVDQQ